MWISLLVSFLSPALAQPSLNGPDDILVGEEGLFVVRGVPAGAQVRLYGSPVGAGSGPCVSDSAGQSCLGILQPALLDMGTASDGGQVVLHGMGIGTTDRVYAQAVVWTDPMLVSDVIPVILLQPGDDADSDGLTNEEERIHGTKPLVADSDEDGASDGAEVVFGTSPHRADSDGDGHGDAADPFPLLAYNDVFEPEDIIVSDTTTSVRDPEFDSVGHRMMFLDAGTVADIWAATVDPATGTIDPTDARGVIVAHDTVLVIPYQNGPEWMTVPGESDHFLFTDESPAGGWETWHAWEDPTLGWQTAYVTDGKHGYGNWDANASTPWIVTKKDLPSGDIVTCWLDLYDPSGEQCLGYLIDWAHWSLNSEEVAGVQVAGDLWSVQILDPNTGTIEVIEEREDVMIETWLLRDPVTGLRTVSWAQGGSEAGQDYVRTAVEQSPGVWTEGHAIPRPPGIAYVNSPEMFYFQDEPYLIFSMHEGSRAHDPGQVWIVAVDPSNPFARRVDDGTARSARDPEPYVTDDGVWVFYTETTENNQLLLHSCRTGLGIY